MELGGLWPWYYSCLPRPCFLMTHVSVPSWEHCFLLVVQDGTCWTHPEVCRPRVPLPSGWGPCSGRYRMPVLQDVKVGSWDPSRAPAALGWKAPHPPATHLSTSLLLSFSAPFSAWEFPSPWGLLAVAVVGRVVGGGWGSLAPQWAETLLWS